MSIKLQAVHRWRHGGVKLTTQTFLAVLVGTWEWEQLRRGELPYLITSVADVNARWLSFNKLKGSISVEQQVHNNETLGERNKKQRETATQNPSQPNSRKTQDHRNQWIRSSEPVTITKSIRWCYLFRLLHKPSALARISAQQRLPAIEYTLSKL